MPIVSAGLASFVEPGDEIAPGLTVVAAPGHTLNQLNLVYESPTGGFVCSADVFHQPIQIYAPQINSRFCEDQEAARVTRARLLRYLAETGSLLMPIHFGPPHAGFVRREAEGYRFEPAIPLASAAA